MEAARRRAPIARAMGAEVIARLGNVLYWLGCGVAAFSALLLVVVIIIPGEQAVHYGMIYAATAVGSWLLGRACKYVLAGE
jgi:hypothetical protein